MPIPNVSRTLILNLIYLLTITVLAFNISPGYVNVFRQLDKCLGNSSRVVVSTNDFIVQRTEEAAEDIENYKPVLAAASEVRKISKEFCIYIDELKVLVAAGGSPLGDPDIYCTAEDNKHATQHYNYKDKDVTMLILLEEGKKGRGLRKKIEETRMAMMEVIMDLLRNGKRGMRAEEFEKVFGAYIPLSIDKDWNKTGAPSWEHYVFNKMPVAASLAMLSKLKSDAEHSEAELIGFLSTLVGIYRFSGDFFPIISTPKGHYVLEGAEYKADIYLALIGRGNFNWSRATISVNGTPVTAKNGVATYSSAARGIGTQKFNVSVAMPRRSTEPPIIGNAVFEYEVIRRFLTIDTDNMNVLYVGVDNPISITAPDIPADQLKVSVSGSASLIGSGKNYVIKPTAIGEAVVKVEGPDFSLDFKFRVKPIPDPLATLGGKDASGEMDEETFKAQKAVFTVLSNFDFDARCSIESFEMHRQAKRADAISVKNEGGAFNEETKALQSMATSGDLYYFDKVLARCPGDSVSRKINAMTWRIR